MYKNGDVDGLTIKPEECLCCVSVNLNKVILKAQNIDDPGYGPMLEVNEYYFEIPYKRGSKTLIEFNKDSYRITATKNGKQVEPKRITKIGSI